MAPSKHERAEMQRVASGNADTPPIGAASIRPEALNEGKLEALEMDLEWLRERQAQFVETTCPACEGASSRPAFDKFGFRFVGCTECRTVYMSPRAPAALLADFYRDSRLYQYWDKYIFPASRDVRRDRIFRPRVTRITEMLQDRGLKQGCLVDVGAANGLFCEVAKEAGVFERVIAVEPSADLAETCARAGIETIHGTVERVADFGVTPDVITAFEVLEHLFSPDEFVRQCVSVLPPGGILVLTCPNYEGFDIQTIGVASESLDAEHINMFNVDSIQLLLNRCGLDVVQCETPGQLDADIVRNAALDGAISLEDQPFLKMILLDRWPEAGSQFQQFLRDSRSSSHMWVVGRKAP